MTDEERGPESKGGVADDGHWQSLAELLGTGGNPAASSAVPTKPKHENSARHKADSDSEPQDAGSEDAGSERVEHKQPSATKASATSNEAKKHAKAPVAKPTQRPASTAGVSPPVADSGFGAGILDNAVPAKTPPANASQTVEPKRPDSSKHTSERSKPVAGEAKPASAGNTPNRSNRVEQPKRDESSSGGTGFGAGLGLDTPHAFGPPDELPIKPVEQPADTLQPKPAQEPQDDVTPRDAADSKDEHKRKEPSESHANSGRGERSGRGSSRNSDRESRSGKSRSRSRSRSRSSRGKSDSQERSAGGEQHENNQGQSTSGRGKQDSRTDKPARKDRPRSGRRPERTDDVRLSSASDSKAAEQSSAKPAESKPAALTTPATPTAPPPTSATSAKPVTSPKQPSHWNKIASFLGLGGAAARNAAAEDAATAESTRTAKTTESVAPSSGGDSIFDSFSKEPEIVESQKFIDSMFGADSTKPLKPESSRSSSSFEEDDPDAVRFIANDIESQDDEIEGSADDEDEDSRPKRGRRRRGSRGRGRGRGRNRSDERTVSESSDSPSDELASESALSDYDAEEEDDIGDAVAVGADALADSENGPQKGRSRNIPSWLDCVGAIVDTNMKNHKKGGNDSRPRRRRRRSSGGSGNKSE